MNYIDLFAGAGGLSEGFIQTGFKPIAYVEMDKAACYSLKTRVAYHYLKRIEKYDVYVSYLKNEIGRQELYDHVPAKILDSVINLSIGEENNDKIHELIQKQLGDKEVDLIIGGPPCQAYSLIGRARSAEGMKGDPRNYLYVQYCNYLEKYQPKMFVFENVPGLQSAERGFHLKSIEDLFNSKGYKMKLFKIEAKQFGVLQNRRRVVIIGWKDSFEPNIPNFKPVNLQNGYNVKMIFSDLPRINAGEGVQKYMSYKTTTNSYLYTSTIREEDDVLTQHIARPNTEQDKEIYRIAVDNWNEKKERLVYNDLPDRLKTHNNKEIFYDRFKVVADNLPYAQTITAHIAKDGHYYIHPDMDQNRSISVREAARLQSFPDNYYFEGVAKRGSRTAAFKQIGNAVPPLMAKAIASVIKDVIKEMYNEERDIDK